MYELWKNNVLDFNTLLLTNYSELELNEQEYVFLVLLARLLQTKPGDWTFADISTHMTIDDANCSLLFISLVERQYISVTSKTDACGKRFEEYSILPLFERIEKYLKQKKNQSQSTQREEIFKMLEQEFGILSPLDIETIHSSNRNRNSDQQRALVLKLLLLFICVDGKQLTDVSLLQRL